MLLNSGSFSGMVRIYNRLFWFGVYLYSYGLKLLVSDRFIIDRFLIVMSTPQCLVFSMVVDQSLQ